MCHGTHKVTCSECDGKKKVGCKKCNGTGKHKCEHCNGTGREVCDTCGGSGVVHDYCPVCDYGKVKKTRWINCDRCHGTGQVRAYTQSGFADCRRCGGRGQVKEYYEEICPSCNGDYRINKNVLDLLFFLTYLTHDVPFP